MVNVGQTSLSPLSNLEGPLGDDVALRSKLDPNVERFLPTLHDGSPDFDCLGLSQAVNLPAVAWKLINLRKLRRLNPEKHAAQRMAISELFDR